jgi:glycosyltransferase involved in cell wall biosynthesis
MADPSSPEPLVSVVIPCYRQARFLDVAIESVLAQDYPRVEIIVVDDGSPDETATVAARYPSVRYVRQPNRGLPSARNSGWRTARGDLVVFLDADDFLLPNAIASGVRTLVARPECAFASGDYQYVDADGRPRNQLPQRFVERDHYRALLRVNYIGMCATVIYRRSALEEAGGFDPALPACEDYDLYLRIAQRRPVCCHRELVAAYRKHDGNMSDRSALMLETVLGVLRRQWRHARADPRDRRAYRDGVRYWRSLYGRALSNRLWASGAGDGPRARRAWWVLARHAPAHALQHAVRRARWACGRVVGGARRLRVSRAGASRSPARPEVGGFRFGHLRRLEPVSRHFGYDRGAPVDRYYIERFLRERSADIRGRVLEIGDDAYTRRYGGDRVKVRDVLHVRDGYPGATIIGDLAAAPGIPSSCFDCVILTQTLHLIYPVSAAIQTLCRILRPGGVVLATVPGISQTSADEWAATWYWSFTPSSIGRLFRARFAPEGVEIEAHGNVLAAVAFLQGIAAGELAQAELDHRDPRYPLLITVHARKPGALE